MNPLFLLLMAGGAMAVAATGRKRKPPLRCDVVDGTGRVYGGGPDIVLPPNVGVELVATKCYPTAEDEFDGYVFVKIDYERMGRDGANFRAVLEQAVIPAAMMSPNIGFTVERAAVSTILGSVGAEHGREVVRIWPTWMDGRPGAYNEPMATPMQIAEVFQYALLRVKEAVEFSWENNGYRWLPSCGVQTGSLFMPDPAFGSVSAIEGSSLQEVLAYDGNTVWGYVDYLMLTKPSGQNWADANEKAHQYARKIMTEMAPPCGLPGFFAKKEEWPPELLLDYNLMAKMIHQWIVDTSGYQIPFKPEFEP